MPALDVSAKRSNSEYVEDASKYAYTAKRFAIKFQPPCLFLEYNEVKTQKTRVRAVKITELSKDMDLDRLTRKVIRSFPRKLDPSSIKYEQVRKLVSKLVDRLQAEQQGTFARPNDLALPKDTALGSPEMPEPGQGGVSPSLQALRGSREVGKDVARDSTESHFSVSDVGSSREPNGKHRHEDLDEAMLQLDRELALDDERRAGNVANSRSSNGRHGQPPQLRSSSAAPSSRVEAAVGQVPQQSNGSRFKQQEAEEEMLTLDIDINEDTDLNRVSEMELRLAKQQMEREFTKHQLKPGEPGYEYDKQIEFGPPTSANDWDDDDDD